MNYLLREVDNAIWKQIKILAAQEGITIKQLIINELEKKIKRNQPNAK